MDIESQKIPCLRKELGQCQDVRQVYYNRTNFRQNLDGFLDDLTLIAHSCTEIGFVYEVNDF